jgi:hypothetical protein
MVLSNEVWTLLSGPTVLSEMEKDPTALPNKIAEKLFGKNAVKEIEKDEDVKSKDAQQGHVPITQEELDRAATTGGFPSRPSDLFLKVSVVMCRIVRLGCL